MSNLKRLESQLEQLERSYKLGIISEDEYTKGKKNLEEKIKPLKEEKKKTEESKKIINEVLSSDKKDTKSSKKETQEKKTSQKAPEEKKTTTKDKKETTEKSTKKQETKKKTTAKGKKDTSKEKKTTAKGKKDTSKEKPREKKPQEQITEKQESRGSIWAGIIIILIVVGAFLMFGGPQETTIDKNVSAKNLTGVNETINIFYYSSYSCEYCQDTNDIMENIDKAYGENVNVVRKHYPYNIELDYEMDIASECAANQEMYDNYSEMLYKEDKPAETDKLITMAEKLGLNKTQFETCLNNNDTAKKVLVDYQSALTMEIKKIPAVYVDGATVTGVKPAPFYEGIIDDALGMN